MGVTLSALERDLARIVRVHASENEAAENDADGVLRGGGKTSVSFFGSMLFSRAVSGTRVVVPGKTQEVGGITFRGFGASHDAYPVPYFTAAAALGTTREDARRVLREAGESLRGFPEKAEKDAKRFAAAKGDLGARARRDGAEGRDETLL